MPHTTIDGRELFYERRGEGEPLLLIQGMSGTHLAWGDPFLEQLDDDFDLVFYDHRGIGRSAPVADAFTIVDLARDAVALLDALGIESAHVLGISMGGMVAQELALSDPQRVRTLTLGCTYAGGAEGRLTDQVVAARLGRALASGDRDEAIRAMYGVNVSSAFAADAANLGEFVAMAKALPAALPVVMLQMQAITAHDTSARLAQIEAPTLVIHGDEDQMLPVANGRAIAAAIPGARLEILEGVGHMFWWEQPQRSAELIRRHALARAGAAS
jgi:pimeloyl-ACP methyl ester carboxylesterase